MLYIVSKFSSFFCNICNRLICPPVFKSYFILKKLRKCRCFLSGVQIAGKFPSLYFLVILYIILTIFSIFVIFVIAWFARKCSSLTLSSKDYKNVNVFSLAFRLQSSFRIHFSKFMLNIIFKIFSFLLYL